MAGVPEASAPRPSGPRWLGHAPRPRPLADAGAHVAVLDRGLCADAPGALAAVEAFVRPSSSRPASVWRLQAWRRAPAAGPEAWRVVAATPALQAPAVEEADVATVEEGEGARAWPGEEGPRGSEGEGRLWSQALPQPLHVEKGDCLGWWHGEGRGFLAHDAHGGDVSWARLARVSAGQLVDFEPLEGRRGAAPRSYAIRACWVPSSSSTASADAAELEPFPCARALSPFGAPPLWRAPAALDCEGPDYAPAWRELREVLAAVAAEEGGLEGMREEDEELLLELAEERLDGFPVEDQDFVSRGVAAFEFGLSGVPVAGVGAPSGDGFCLYGVVAAMLLRARGLLRQGRSQGAAYELLHFGSVLLGLSKAARDFLESSAWPVRSAHLVSLLQQRTSPLAPPETDHLAASPDSLWPSPDLHLGLAAVPGGAARRRELCGHGCGPGARVVGHAVVLRPLVDDAAGLSFVDTSLCVGEEGLLRRLRVYLRARPVPRPTPGVEGIALQVWRPGPESELGQPAYALVAESGMLEGARVGYHDVDLGESAMPVAAGDCVGWRYTEGARGAISYAEADEAPMVRWRKGKATLGEARVFEEGGRRVYSLSLSFGAAPGCLPVAAPPFAAAAAEPEALAAAAADWSGVRGDVLALRLAGLGDHVTGTLEPATMAREALQHAGVDTELRFFGHPCPADERAKYHCSLRCELLDQCGEQPDAVAEWLTSSLDYQGFAERNTSWSVLEASLAAAIRSEPFLASEAEAFACGHPAVLCLALAAVVTPRPVLIYLQSTLLYGAPGCGRCEQPGHTLRYFESAEARSYFERFQRTAGLPSVALLTNCPFASAQIWYQTGVVAASAPNQALYATARWAGEMSEALLLPRGPFYQTSMGQNFVAMLAGFISANSLPLRLELLEKGSGFLSHAELASRRAALLMPHDLGVHTFNVLYRLALPIFAPDRSWAFRLHRAMPWGWTAYGGALPDDAPGPDGAPLACLRAQLPFSPWLDVDASAAEVEHWSAYANAATFPFVQHFNSVPSLLTALHEADLPELSRSMRGFSAQTLRGARRLYAAALTRALRGAAGA